MVTMPTRPPGVRDLPVVAGHLALDFANTVDDPLGPARYDHVSTYADLVAWSVGVDATSAPHGARLIRAATRRADEAAGTLARAHRLRDVLNDLFGAVVDGTDVARPWARLRPFVAEAVTTATLLGGEAGRLQWSWPQRAELGAPLHPVASAAAELLVGEDLRRVKRCARCPWLFLDGSKNRSRRWCDMADCGAAVKRERYVARRSAQRRETGG